MRAHYRAVQCRVPSQKQGLLDRPRLDKVCSLLALSKQCGLGEIDKYASQEVVSGSSEDLCAVRGW